jgi:predicted O-methyltransferase YrrM
MKVGAEIGVEQGIFSEIICQQNPGIRLYCVDAWRAYKGYRDHTRQEKLDRYFEETTQRLSPYNTAIIRDWSMDALKAIEDESLDFVYIDANHDFKHVAEDIAEWSKKVKPGGIVAGHDYVRNRSSIECQVKDVVDAWGHAYGIKINVTEDEFPSWWYIK